MLTLYLTITLILKSVMREPGRKGRTEQQPDSAAETLTKLSRGSPRLGAARAVVMQSLVYSPSPSGSFRRLDSRLLTTE